MQALNAAAPPPRIRVRRPMRASAMLPPAGHRGEDRGAEKPIDIMADCALLERSAMRHTVRRLAQEPGDARRPAIHVAGARKQESWPFEGARRGHISGDDRPPEG